MSDEDQIIAVIDRFWDVVVEVRNPPDPESDLWDEVATGSLMENVTADLAVGEAARHPDGNPENLVRLEVLTLEDEFALVNLCLRDDTIAYDMATGAILNDEVLYVHIQHQVEPTEAGWRVSRSFLIESFEEESSCVESF